MTPSEAERRLHLLEGTVHMRYPAPAPPPTALEQWAQSVSCEVLERCERMCRVMADDPERGDHPMTDFERSLVEVATLDFDNGDADSVQRSYRAGEPYDLADPAMAEARAWVDDWIVGVARVFMAGADVRGWLAWHGIVVDALVAGELVRLAAVLRIFEEHPIEAAALQSDALWAVIGSDGHRKRHGMA